MSMLSCIICYFDTIIYVCIIIIATCIHAHNYVFIPCILSEFITPLCNGNYPTPPPCTLCTSNIIIVTCIIFVSIENYVSCLILRIPHFYVLYSCPNTLCKPICIHVTPRQLANFKSNSQKALQTSLTFLFRNLQIVKLTTYLFRNFYFHYVKQPYLLPTSES